MLATRVYVLFLPPHTAHFRVEVACPFDESERGHEICTISGWEDTWSEVEGEVVGWADELWEWGGGVWWW